MKDDGMVLFKTQNYNIAEINEEDIKQITKIYNSNPIFLKSHLSVEAVAENWVLEEYKYMQKLGFSSCKIVDIEFNEVVGFMDFKISEETYLPLIIIDGQKKTKGIGSEVLKCFEKYAKAQGSKYIRIDVAANYKESSLGFWEKRGFVAQDEIKLSWGEISFPAIKMIKEL